MLGRQRHQKIRFIQLEILLLPIGKNFRTFPQLHASVQNHLHKLWHRITFVKPLNLVHEYFSGYLFTVAHIRAEYVLFYSKND